MTSIVKEALVIARSLVEKGWTQGVMARTNTGVSVNIKNPAAVCWCTAGAMLAGSPAADDSTKEQMFSAFREANGINEHGIMSWNDARGRKQQDVLTAFDKAILLVDPITKNSNDG